MLLEHAVTDRLVASNLYTIIRHNLGIGMHGRQLLTYAHMTWLGCLQIVKDKQEFERVEVSREEALSMFAENKFKSEIIQGLPSDTTISLYRCGPMVPAPHPS